MKRRSWKSLTSAPWTWKYFLCLVFFVQCETAIELANIGQRKARHRYRGELGIEANPFVVPIDVTSCIEGDENGTSMPGADEVG